MKVLQVKTRKKEGVAAGFRAARRERQSNPAAFNPIALLSRSTEEDYPQAKLKVGSPGDIYEQEADQTAERVMSMPGPVAQRQIEEEEQEEPIQEKSLLQLQAEEEEEPVQEKSILQLQDEEEEESLQTKSKPGETPTANPSLESQINSLKGGGRPLPKSTRAFFEPRFDRDFSNVRVHTDSKVSETAKAVNAQVFTTGSNIAFAQGKYDPETSSGKRLLAHELTHVVQQRNGNSIIQCQQRKPKRGKSPTTKRLRRIPVPKTGVDAIPDHKIKETQEFRDLMDSYLKWQWQHHVVEKEALLVCRLMISDIKAGRPVFWRKKGVVLSYINRARKIISKKVKPKPKPAQVPTSNLPSISFRRRSNFSPFNLPRGHSLKATIDAQRVPKGCNMPNEYKVYLYNFTAKKYETTVTYEVDKKLEYTWKGLTSGTYYLILQIYGNVAAGCKLKATLEKKYVPAITQIIPVARHYAGSAQWAYKANRPPYGPNTNKCNLFVYEILNEAGASVPMKTRDRGWFKGIFKARYVKHPPLAGQWADRSVSIPGWKVVNTPQVGDVAAEAGQYSNATGHVGIVSAVTQGGKKGKTISASATTNTVVENTWGFRGGQNVVFRRYVGK